MTAPITLQSCPGCGFPFVPAEIGADVRLVLSIRGGSRTELSSPLCMACADAARTGVRAALETMKAAAVELLHDVEGDADE